MENKATHEILLLVIQIWLVTSFVFFIALGLLISGAANWIMAGIATLFAALPIFLFCYLGALLIIRLKNQSNTLIKTSAIIFGLAFGYAGYFFANLVAYFQTTILAFLVAGVVAGLLVSAKVTANKQLQLTRRASAPHN